MQRDILPIVEGTTVNTKYGMVRTDHILFIAAGAFHVSKPSDLIPELQGRFPIRVELEALGKDEFVRILTEPRSALVKQYMALMETEGIDADASPTTRSDASPTSRRIVNERTENIGARRLHTVMEKLLDEISFEGPDLAEKTVVDRRGVRHADARRHRQERRPVPVHSVSRERGRAVARGSALTASALSVRRRGSAVGCGKKGPPLPPLVQLPAPPADSPPRGAATTRRRSISRVPSDQHRRHAARQRRARGRVRAHRGGVGQPTTQLG